MQPDDGVDVAKTCIVFINNTESSCAQMNFFLSLFQVHYKHKGVSDIMLAARIAKL
jgi:hypothetical protein